MNDDPRKCIITFTVPGKPSAWQRSMPVGRGRIVKTKKQRGAQAIIAWHGRRTMEGREPFKGPLKMVVTCYMPIPLSWSEKKKAMARVGEIRPTSKPDRDNLGKQVGDALNGVCYVDDAQVVDGQDIKLYSDVPRTVIYIEEI